MTKTRGYNGPGIDPSSAGIYVADAIDSMQRGVVYRFTPDGIPVDTFRLAINQIRMEGWLFISPRY